MNTCLLTSASAFIVSRSPLEGEVQADRWSTPSRIAVNTPMPSCWGGVTRHDLPRLQQLDWFSSGRNNPMNHHTKPTVGRNKLHFEVSATPACLNLATSAIKLET